MPSSAAILLDTALKSKHLQQKEDRCSGTQCGMRARLRTRIHSHLCRCCGECLYAYVRAHAPLTHLSVCTHLHFIINVCVCVRVHARARLSVWVQLHFITFGVLTARVDARRGIWVKPAWTSVPFAGSSVLAFLSRLGLPAQACTDEEP